VNKILSETETAQETQLLALSDEAIRLIIIKSLTDPENASQIEILKGSRRSTNIRREIANE